MHLHMLMLLDVFHLLLSVSLHSSTQKLDDKIM